MTDKATVTWEVPSNHQLLLSLPEPQGSIVTRPYPNADEVIYLFMDEAGNFDFSQNGTRYFIMTCVVAKRPLVLDATLLNLKYDLIEEGYPLELFHASSDRDVIRSSVYKAISGRQGSVRAYAAVVDKRELPSELKREDVLYSRVFELLTDEIYRNETSRNTRTVVIITDSLPQQKKKKNVEKPLKAFMKSRFQANGIAYRLMHHQSCSSMYLQVADYLCWAVYRQYDKGRDWPMKNVASCFREIGQISYDTDKEGDGAS